MNRKNSNKKGIILLIVALILIIAVVVGIVIFINNQRYNYELSEIQDGEFQYYKLEKDGKYGVIDRNGNVIIEPT